MNKPVPTHIEDLLEPDIEFNNELVGELEGMISSIARFYSGYNDTLHKDLCQEGWIGVHAACEDYRDDKGARLKTYAYYKARGKMQSYMRHKVKVVNPPRREAASVEIVGIDVHADSEPWISADWTDQIDLNTALDTLDYLTRTLVVEHVCKGVYILDLAAVHGICRNKASRIINEGIEQLRSHLL